MINFAKEYIQVSGWEMAFRGLLKTVSSLLVSKVIFFLRSFPSRFGILKADMCAN